jgi:hypothetical protein
MSYKNQKKQKKHVAAIRKPRKAARRREENLEKKKKYIADAVSRMQQYENYKRLRIENNLEVINGGRL